MEKHAPRTVVVILDPAYGKMPPIPPGGAYWIIDSDINRLGAPALQANYNVSFFEAVDPSSPMQTLEQSIPDILDHFGPDSFPDRRYNKILVLGLDLTRDVRSRLEQMGFKNLEKLEGGFSMGFPSL